MDLDAHCQLPLLESRGCISPCGLRIMSSCSSPSLCFILQLLSKRCAFGEIDFGLEATNRWKGNPGPGLVDTSRSHTFPKTRRTNPSCCSRSCKTRKKCKGSGHHIRLDLWRSITLAHLEHADRTLVGLKERQTIFMTARVNTAALQGMLIMDIQSFCITWWLFRVVDHKS